MSDEESAEISAHGGAVVFAAAKLISIAGPDARYGDVLRELMPYETVDQAVFAGELMQAVLTAFAGVLDSHPQGHIIRQQVQARADSYTFEEITRDLKIDD